MTANVFAYKESPEERRRVAAALEKMGVSYPSKRRAEVVDRNIGQSRRRPLGLRPAEEPDDDEYLGPQATAEKIVAGSLALLTPEAKAKPATMEDLWVYGIGTGLETSFEGGEELRKRMREVRGEIAEVKAAQRIEVAELKTVIAELRAEVSALRSVQESQRIQSRGEQGVAGPRGVPGDRGPVGPAGPQGLRGEAAAMIVGWEPTPERFVLTPVLGDGTRGVSAHLLPFFEAYDAQVEANDDEE
jgi:hypothetical protein